MAEAALGISCAALLGVCLVWISLICEQEWSQHIEEFHESEMKDLADRIFDLEEKLSKEGNNEND